MTETEQQAAELDDVIEIERARQTELCRVIATGAAVWDSILGRWVEVVR